MYGELNEQDEMEIEYYYPYILNEEVTSRAECSIQRHTEKETYAGLLDEYKVGLSLIFYLLNPIEYRECYRKERERLQVNSVSLAGFANRGKVLLPIKKTDKVLEVGSGCGAITGALSRKAGSVTCVDLSKKRSLINAYRHSESENVTIHIGNFTDVEPDLPADYDYICLIGVFEYGQAYIGGSTPYEDFLKILQKHLAPGGRIVIAIENKYGLKYFAG